MAAPKQWTLLIFMNGNNSLDSYTDVNLKQIEQVGSTPGVNVVVEWASEHRGKTVRMLMQKSTTPDKIVSPVLQDMGQIDMGDYKELVSFVQWGVEKFPAEHYGIVVWDHGSGWHSIMALNKQFPSLPYNLTPFDISVDDNTGNKMTTQQLGVALQQSAALIGHPVDFYGSDACLMDMAEVAGEMQDSVIAFGGSEETEPGTGWPYQEWLSKFTADQDGIALAKILAVQYTASYQGGSNGTSDVTFAALDLRRLQGFEKAWSDFAVQVQNLTVQERSNFLQAAQASVSFTDSDYVDAGSLLDNVNAFVPSLKLDAVRDSMSALIQESKVTQKFQGASGIAIWVPKDQDTYLSYKDAYETLRFERETHWGDALKTLF